MSIKRFLTDLAKKKVIVSLAGENLSIKGKVSSLSEQDKSSLKANKEEILNYLREKALQNELVKVPLEGGTFPFSISQKGLWLATQTDPDSTLYNMPSAFRIDGNISLEALNLSFKSVCHRHVLLHAKVTEDSSEPRWRVTDSTPEITIIEELETEPREFLSAQMDMPFDLINDFAIRAYWLADKTTPGGTLFVTTHHLVSDMLSINVMLSELQALYEHDNNQTVLAPLQLEYSDYATWQNSEKSKATLNSKLSEYANWIAEAPSEHSLLLSNPRNSDVTHSGEHYSHALDEQATQGLIKHCEQSSATLYMGLHAIVSKTLAILSGERDIVLAVPMSNRPADSLMSTVGFFINTLVVPCRVEAGMDLAKSVNNSRLCLTKAYQYQDIPFYMLMGELNPTRNWDMAPLAQIVLSLEYGDGNAPFSFGESLVTPVENDIDNARYDITITARLIDSKLTVNWEYKRDIFEPNRIQAFAEALNSTLKAMVEGDEPIHTAVLDCVTDASMPTVPEQFNKQLDKYHDKLAVIEEQATYTYQQLDQESNQIAHFLAEQQLKSTARVGIILPRGGQWIASALAVLKAGYSYVPINESSDDVAVENMIKAAEIEVVITSVETFQNLDCIMDLPVLIMDDGIRAGMLEKFGTEPIHTEHLVPDSEAYVIFTSGTTGKPKGVRVPHNGISRLALDSEYFKLDDSVTMLHSSNVAFDAATFEIWAPLLNGGQIIVSKSGPLALEESKQLIQKYEVNWLWLTSKVFDIWSQKPGQLKGLEHIAVGGEVVSPLAVKEAYQQEQKLSIFNAYGPTENTTFTTVFKIPQNTYFDVLPIGTPIAETGVVILDENGKLLPECARGQIATYGKGLALGYVNNAALTQKKFKVIEINGKEVQTYLTGDVGFIDEHGQVNILGRNDNQVKIRGYRVDLEAIAETIRDLPFITHAYVTFLADKLAIAVVLCATEEVSLQRLRNALSSALPEYMLPQYLKQIAQLPTNENGKIDSAELSRIEFTSLDQSQFVKAVTQTEQALFEIWQGILEHQDFGTENSFFDVGGNSIFATQVLLDIEKALAKKVSLKALFEHQTIRALAKLVDETQAVGTSLSLPEVDKSIPHVCSSAQHRLWYAEQTVQSQGQFAIPVALKLPLSVNSDALCLALKDIVSSHLIFRTKYGLSGDGALEQSVMPSEGFSVKSLQLNSDAHLNQVLAEENKRKFDLSCDYSLHAQLSNAIDDSYQYLLLTFHHIAFDGWSMSIFSSELQRAYEARCEGHTYILDGRSPQYIDYAVWEQSDENQQTQLRLLEQYQAKLKGLDNVTFPHLPVRLQDANQDQGNVYTQSLSSNLYKGITNLAKANNTTLYTCLYAAFVATLHRFSNQQDIVVGSAQANRGVVGTEEMIGFFVNALPLHTFVDAEQNIGQLLAECKQELEQASNFQSLPMDKLARNSSATNDKLFQVMLTLQNNRNSELSLGQNEIELIEKDKLSSEYDVTLNILINEDGLTCKWIYKQAHYNEQYIKVISSVFEHFVIALIEQRETAIGRLDLQSDELSVEPLKTSKRLNQMISEAATANPDKVAVNGEVSLTYAELEAKANQLAHYLTEMGVQPLDSVAAIMNRDVEVIIAIQAIAKVGATYVPIDIANPFERIEKILENTSAQVVLTNSTRLPDELYRYELVNLKDVEDDLASFDLDFISSAAQSVDDVCYIIHTSGSTGEPKGVMISHASLYVYLQHAKQAYFSDAHQSAYVTTSLAFDATLTTLLTPLILGSEVHLVANGEELSFLQRMTSIDRPAVFKLTPTHVSALNSFLLTSDVACQLPHCFVIGGEALSIDVAKQLQHSFPNASIINEYGPTEATVGCIVAKYDTNASAFSNVEIGTPIQYSTAKIVSAQGGRQPNFAVGEIILAGHNLAKGYLRQGQVDTEPFRYYGEVAYATGDFAFACPNQGMVYMGRSDEQIKLRGFRVELGEIASVLTGPSAIDEVKITLMGEGENTSLAAFAKLSKTQMPELFGAVEQLERLKGLGSQAQIFTMPDGSHMLGLNQLETEYLYEEIVRDATYNKHNISLEEGATVIDVGANIGFFSHYLAKSFNDIQVYAFEPIGPIFEVLEANARRTEGKVKVFNEGLSNRSYETIFNYYPNVTVFSGVQLGHDESVDTIQGFLKHSQAQMSESDVEQLISNRFESQEVAVKLSTLSEHIDAASLECIDLLKIDVERCEMEVLEGIKEAHWQIIKQIVVEVHDQDDNIEKMVSLLSKHGFSTYLDQNTELGGTELVNIYAKRKSQSQSLTEFSYQVVNDGVNQTELRSQLNQACKASLPEYMCPQAIELVAQWPLTSNGKLDEKALTTLVNDKYSGRRGSAASTPEAKQLAVIWVDLFSLDSPPFTEDDFFSLGGHSLLLMKLIAEVRAHWQVEVSIKEVYEHSTLAALATLITSKVALLKMTEAAQSHQSDGTEVVF